MALAGLALLAIRRREAGRDRARLHRQPGHFAAAAAYFIGKPRPYLEPRT